MQFTLTILGTNSAIPCYGRHPSAQIVDHAGQIFLFDCGEGTQMRLMEEGVRYMRIDHIFISHLHGDHVYGLPGLLNSMGIQGRERELHIYGPHGIRELIETVLRICESLNPFVIHYHELKEEGCHRIFQNPVLRIYSFPLKHRIRTNGFLVKEQPVELNIKAEVIGKYDLSIAQIKKVKAGKDIVTKDGRKLNNSLLTEAPSNLRSYAYCTDTAYSEELIQFIRGVDLLFHEATFLHALLEKAKRSGHSTARQAGEIAREAGAGRLIIGHYSSRYQDLQPLLEEARAVFPETELAVEGKSYSVGRGGV